MTEAEYEALLARQKQAGNVASQPVSPSLPVKAGESIKKPKGPNKTESSYMAALGFEFPGCGIKFEQVTFHLDNGHAYTPDIVVWGEQFDGGALFVEVKNSAFKHASYGRSRMGFDQCRIEHLEFKWRWAEKTKEGWTVKDY
jgi:hypothetical protein